MFNSKKNIVLFIILSLLFICNTVSGRLLEERRNMLLDTAEIWIVSDILSPTSVEIVSTDGQEIRTLHLLGILPTGNPAIDNLCMAEMMRFVFQDEVWIYFIDDIDEDSYIGYLYYADLWFLLNASLLERGLVYNDENSIHWLMEEFAELQADAIENNAGIWGEDENTYSTMQYNDAILADYRQTENQQQDTDDQTANENASENENVILINQIGNPEVLDVHEIGVPYITGVDNPVCSVIYNNNIYLADSGNSLVVIDVSIPQSPYKIKSFEFEGSPVAMDIVTEPNALLYLLTNNPVELFIIDLSNNIIAFDVFLEEEDIDMGNVNMDTTAYYTWISGENYGVRVVGFLDNQPYYAGRYELPGITNITAMGQYSFVLDNTVMTYQVLELDRCRIDIIGEPESLDYSSLTISGDYAFAISQGLTSFSIDEQANLIPMGTLSGFDPVQLQIDSGVLYCIDKSNMLYYMDISDPANISAVQTVSLAGYIGENVGQSFIGIGNDNIFLLNGDRDLIVLTIANPE